MRAAAGGECWDSDGGSDSLLVVSEPLDNETGHWTSVDENSLLVAENGQVKIQPLRLAAARTAA